MKKICVIGLTIIMSTAVLSGCGKKKETVGDSLIKENSNEIQGMDKYANLSVDDESSDEVVIPDSSYGEPGDDVSENAVSADSVSGDMVSDNSVSDNEAGIVSANIVSENAVIGDSSAITPVTADEFDISEYDKSSDELCIINMSGQNFKQIYISFTVGDINNKEILGEKRLNDGYSYSYKIDDIDSLKSVQSFKLTITAVTKKDKTIEFGEIQIIDPTNMVVILTNDNGKYSMYSR